MFEIAVQAEFSAAHSLVIKGEREPVHGHNWGVTVTLVGPEVDSEGLLCDFHLLERSLRKITGSMNNRSLNDLDPFSRTPSEGGVNPSAELVARYIAEALEQDIGPSLGSRARVSSVRVTEAPGCAATYFPPVPPAATMFPGLAKKPS